MSAIGQLRDFVERALAPLHKHQDEQDAAIKDLQDRVAALEGRSAPARKPQAVKAQAGTAQGKGASGERVEPGPDA